VEVRIPVGKWNIYEAHIFPRSLLKTCRLETTSLCLNTRLRVNKKFQNSHFFIEININVCVLCAHPVMTSIILHTRRPNSQWKVCYAHGLYVSADFFFAFWGAEKHVYHNPTFCATRYVLKSFRCQEISNRVRNWNKAKKKLYGVEISIMPIGNTNIHININVSHFISNFSFISVLWI